MKVFKNNHLSVMPRAFGVAGRLRFALGVLVFFDLADPDSLLKEQELWKTVPPLLGPQPVLDQGVPKPRGEVLVTGECCAPGSKPVQGLEVSLRAGTVRKRVHVFGDRWWNAGTISDPAPFTRMPLTWDRAFGGPDVAANPVGRGAAKVDRPDGSKARPLPNVEDPARLVGSPDDAPPPAGFGPLDVMWPPRKDKAGAYGDQWLRNRWPWFPDDMNYEFFNAAPEDQYLEGFFQGGEALEITHMHPDYEVIRSHVPRVRIRAFATMNPEFRHHVFPSFPLPSQQMAEHEEFREIRTRLETVWLFPTVMRGVAIFRGATDVLDEEYGDVVRLLVAEESLDDAPKDMDWYLEDQKRRLRRGADLDPAPMEKGKAAYAKAQRSIRNLPKLFGDVRSSFQGAKPAMPPREPEEMLDKALAKIAKQRAFLTESETRARDLMRRHGPLGGLDLGLFAASHQKLDAVEAKAKTAAARLSKAKQSVTQAAAQAKDEVGAAIDKADKRLAKRPRTADVAMDQPKELDAEPPFHEVLFPLVVSWRRRLQDDDFVRAALKRCGFDSAQFKRHWLGVNPEPVVVDPKEWGAPGAVPVTLPPGLVLPRFEGRTLVALSIRPWTPDADTQGSAASLAEGANDIELADPASPLEPLFLMAASLIDLPALPAADAAPVVRVADAFQALWMEQEVGDFCSVLALVSPEETPPKDALAGIKAGSPRVVVLGADQEPGRELRAWAEVFPGAVALPLKHGVSVFHDAARREDLRARILDLLPPEQAAAHDIGLAGDAKDEGAGAPSLKPIAVKLPDIGAIAKGLRSELASAQKARLEAARNQALQEIRDTVAPKAEQYANRVKGLDPAKITLEPSGKAGSPEQAAREMAATLRKQGAIAQKKGKLSPEQAGVFEDNAKKMDKLADFGEAKRAELEAKRKELQEKKTAAGGGAEPSDYPALTREQVQERHAAGQSLARTVLDGVDLSGLDLSGADFSECRMNGADFTNATLDGAAFTRSLANKAAFSNASLKGATLSRVVCNKARFDGADLSGVRCDRASFQEADCTGAVWTRAEVRQSSFAKAIMDKGVFAEGYWLLSAMGSSAVGADFRLAKLTRCVFKKTVLDDAIFTGATLERTLFQEARGERVDFSNATLDRLRSMKNTSLPGANFSGSSLRSAGLRDTDFANAVFRDCDLGEAVLSNCRLTGADCYHMKAVKCRITKCDLESANLRGVNLYMGSLRKSRLVRTDLTGANCYAVDFYKAVVGRTLFDGALLAKSVLDKRVDLLEDGKEGEV